jgi:hypothetical protein
MRAVDKKQLIYSLWPKLEVEKRLHCGTTMFIIKAFKDVDSLLEHGWHWRGLNEAGDFCYVLLHSVEYYNYPKRPLKEFLPSTCSTSSNSTMIERELGYGLIFPFVRGDGVPSQFGTDCDIFD